jgi:hypothetical protein
MAGRAELDQADLRAKVAIAALTSPVRAVARRFRRKAGYVAYWKRKLTDPAFHPQPCGGDYNRKFDAASQLAFEVRSPFWLPRLLRAAKRVCFARAVSVRFLRLFVVLLGRHLRLLLRKLCGLPGLNAAVCDVCSCCRADDALGRGAARSVPPPAGLCLGPAAQLRLQREPRVHQAHLQELAFYVQEGQAQACVKVHHGKHPLHVAVPRLHSRPYRLDSAEVLR